MSCKWSPASYGNAFLCEEGIVWEGVLPQIYCWGLKLTVDWHPIRSRGGGASRSVAIVMDSKNRTENRIFTPPMWAPRTCCASPLQKIILKVQVPLSVMCSNLFILPYHIILWSGTTATVRGSLYNHHQRWC